jgi:LPXTG-site transpeptidase (sortase) family protein
MKKTILLSLGVGLLTAGLSGFLQTRLLSAETTSTTDALPPAVFSVAGQGSSVETSGNPVRLVIPAIGVDAAVQSVGLAWQGTGNLGIPTNFTDVGWYNQGPAPGEPGSAVIDGHLDGHDVREAVFYNLDKLKVGDTVEVVDRAGKMLQFKVVDTKVYDYDAPTDEVFSGDSSKARLNLITCAGSWDKTQKLYNKRIVVFTELVGE